MAPWLKNVLMLGVLSVWTGYMIVSVTTFHQMPPLPLWGVPGATYALLTGKAPKWTITKDPEE